MKIWTVDHAVAKPGKYHCHADSNAKLYLAIDAEGKDDNINKPVAVICNRLECAVILNEEYQAKQCDDTAEYVC